MQNDKLKLKKRPLKIHDCGLAEYRGILQLQKQLLQKRGDGEIVNTVLIVEHQPVITLGARQSANKLIASKKTLAKMGIDVVEIRRGGGVTAHNPGQVVFYPIFDLKGLGLGVNEYVRTLEALGTELLGQLAVQSDRKKEFPGLWAGERKIASIGVRVWKQVTYHGMAINIQNNLSIFDHIVPCGLDGVEMTSVYKETGKDNSMQQIKTKLCELLAVCFSSEDSFEYAKGS
jgi:lipoate-protein ligase B